MTRIGVLAYQGSVIEHMSALKKLKNVEAVEVKYPDVLDSIDGIILPGGESTAIGKMLRRFDMLEPLKTRIKNGMAAWGTCAGMILLAKSIIGQTQTHLEVMDIAVRRNAYGGQLNSFSTLLDVKGINRPCQAVFVRAPWIESTSPNVEVLATYDGNIVAVRQNNMLATSFHPELTPDTTFCQYFVDLARRPNDNN